MQIKIGTRASPLALAQVNMAIMALRKVRPDLKFEIVPITTTGDKIQNKTLYEIGGKALFLKELEVALKEGIIDVAVHSYKDVPGRLSDEFTICSVLPRCEVNDCFISCKYKSIDDLPPGAIIGTSSPRRRVILHHLRPDLTIEPIRGKIETRLAKISSGQYDATILSACGLRRMDYFSKIPFYQILPTEVMLPAIAQGAICFESLADNKFIIDLCREVNHEPTAELIAFERSFLACLEADCKTPAAAYAAFDGAMVKTKYMLADFDSYKIKYFETVTKSSIGPETGINVGNHLKKLINS